MKNQLLGDEFSPAKFPWVMGATLLLMVTAGLLAVITSFLFHVKPSWIQIFCGYGVYLLVASTIIALNRKSQFYFSILDFIVLAFMSLVVLGLLNRIGGIGQIEATKNSIYFILFAFTPFILGRTFSTEAIVWFEALVISVLLLVLALIPLTGGFNWPTGAIRPKLFSTVYSNLSLSFVLGIGVLVSVWRGCVTANKGTSLAYGALLILFCAGSAIVVMRGSYYLTILCAISLLIFVRKEKSAPLISVALGFGIALGLALSHGSVSYHEKLLRPDLNQLPFDAIYSDFFSAGALNIEPGRPVLAHINCLPIVESNDSTMIRIMLYLEAAKMFLSAPFLGIGVSRFSEFSCLSTNGFPHSTILQVGAEMGLVGLALFMSLILVSARILYRAAASNKLPYWVFFVFLYYLVLDQIYGSYFCSSVTYFMAGLASRMLANQRINRYLK